MISIQPRPAPVVGGGDPAAPLQQAGHQAQVAVITAVHEGGPTAPVTAVHLGLGHLSQHLQVTHTGRCVAVEGREDVWDLGSAHLTCPERQSNPEELLLTETVVLKQR